MKHVKNKASGLFILGAASIGLSGCLGGNQASFSAIATQALSSLSPPRVVVATPTPTPSVSPTPTSLPIPVITPTPTPTPTPVVTPTPSPSPSVSPTPTGTPTPPVVCDPLAMTQGGMGSSATAGLTGEIRSLIWPAPYPSPTPSPRATIQPIPTVRGNLQANTDPSSSYQVTDSLFLSSVNVPERTYTSGFVDSTGALLKDSSGRILTEYFYLHLRSSVKLGGTTTAPGLYQFAIISDDGSAVAVETSKKPDGTSVFTRVIDNDMTTASRFVGADRAINFDANTRLPIDLQYFQGPQAYIAVMLMWRKVPTGSSASLYDPLQGVSGSSAFHSYDTKTGISDPQQKFLDLLARGWKVLEPANYELPQGTRPNPCATPGP